MNINKRGRALLIAACIVAGGAISASAQGKLEVQGGNTYDWGNVRPGELTASIKVKNVGDKELKVDNIQKSCGCTSADIDKNVLKPGETGAISVKIGAQGFSGGLQKTITINSSDAVEKAVTVTLVANIRPVITCEPSQYFLLAADAKVGKASISRVTLTNTSDEPVTLFPPELASGSVKVTFDLKKKKVLKPGQKQDLVVHVTPTAAGPVNAVVRLKTSSKELPQMDFGLFGSVTATAQDPARRIDVAGAASHK